MSRLERLYSPPEIGAPGKRAAHRRYRDLLYSGVFVLLMGGVALGALALLRPGLFGVSYELRAFFQDGQGLIEGVKVTLNGRVIGLVEDVTAVFPGQDPDAAHCPPDPPGAPRSPALPCFRATLLIGSSWPVPTDSRVQLVSAGLLQGDILKVEPGPSAELLGDGALIATREREADLGTQLATLATTLQGLVSETLAPALTSIRDQIKTIEGLLGTGATQEGNQQALAGAFTSLQHLSARIDGAVDEKKIAAIIDSVDTLSRNLSQVSGELKGNTGQMTGAVREYGALAKDIRGLVIDIKPGLQRSLNDTQYLLQELTSGLIPVITDLQDFGHNAAALSRDLRENPAVIIKGRAVEEKTPWFK